MTPRKRGYGLALFGLMILFCAIFALVTTTTAATPPAPEVALTETGQCSCPACPLIHISIPAIPTATAKTADLMSTTCATTSTIDVKNEPAPNDSACNERHGGLDHRPRICRHKRM
jgi:hypothetical protein